MSNENQVYYEYLLATIGRLELVKRRLCFEAEKNKQDFYDNGQADLLCEAEYKLAMYRKEAEQILDAIRKEEELEV